MKQIIKVVLVIIGTTIGAGFASGQEIWLFFNQYGKLGIIGMIISCILSGIIIYQVLSIIQKENISSYEGLIEKISNKKILSQAITLIVSAFLLITFYIMIAGMSAYFNGQLKIPTFICSTIMAILCYITLQKNMKGIMLVNSILIPCLIIFIIYLSIQNIDFSINYFNKEQLASVTSNNSLNWLWSGILYTSYNSITLIPMLVELKQYINTKKKAKLTSITCTGILIILGISLFCLLLRGGNTISTLELPMVEIVKQFGNTYYTYIYGVVIVGAIFTTAISAGYSLLKNEIAKKQFTKGDIIKRKEKYYQKILLAICLTAPIVAELGFTNLVSILYPIFGILGLVQMIYLFRNCKKNTL